MFSWCLTNDSYYDRDEWRAKLHFFIRYLFYQLRAISESSISILLSIVEPAYCCASAPGKLPTFKHMIEELQDQIVEVHVFLSNV